MSDIQQGTNQPVPFIENPIVIGISLLFCFPAGLYFVWRHPTWNLNQKRWWTGAFCAFFLLGMIGSAMEEKNVVHQSKDGSSSNEKGGGLDSQEGVEWATDLLDAMRNNAAAKQKYGSKKITIKGWAFEVKEGYPSEKMFARKKWCVRLGGQVGPNGYTSWVECFFASEKQAAAVPLDSHVKIRGKVQDKIGDVVRMVDCELVP